MVNVGATAFVWCVASLIAGAPATVSAQQNQAGQARTATLTVAGDIISPLSLSPADLKDMPRTSVEVTADGWTLTYEGVLVGEILKRAGVPLGDALRADAVASYVLAGASDGYQVVFSLAELDPAFTNNDIILADTVDGEPLSADQGPVRIVAPNDSRGARSIRMLERLEVIGLRN